MRKALTAGLGVVLLLVAGAVAQERETVEETRTTTKVRRISTVMGGEVRLRTDTLGKVTDIVFNEHGCIEYLIVRDEEEFVAVPWGAVRYEAGEKTITVTTTVTREKLKSMRFRSSDWPDFRSERWIRSAGEVWGEKSLRREHRDDNRPDASRKDDKRKGDIRPDDKRKDDIRREDIRPDDRRKDDKRPDDKRKGDIRPDDRRKDDIRRDDLPRDDKRKDDKRPDDKRKDGLRPPVRDKDNPDRP